MFEGSCISAAYSSRASISTSGTVSMCGGVQTQVLLEFFAMNMCGDGFIDRLVMLCPEIVKRTLLESTEARGELNAIHLDLASVGEDMNYFIKYFVFLLYHKPFARGTAFSRCRYSYSVGREDESGPQRNNMLPAV